MFEFKGRVCSGPDQTDLDAARIFGIGYGNVTQRHRTAVERAKKTLYRLNQDSTSERIASLARTLYGK